MGGQIRSADAGGERRTKRWPGRYGRRAVLAGAAAAGAGAVASLAGGSGVAQASGKPVELGQTSNTAGTTAVITSSGTGLQGQTTTEKASGVAGIDLGSTGTGHGTYGISVRGTGVYGKLGTESVPPPTSAAVGGYDASEGGNVGVYGYSATGTGVYATTDAGTALQVDGLATFGAQSAVYIYGPLNYGNCGVATVPKGKKSATTSGPFYPGAIVLATIQQAESGVYLEAAEPSTGKLTITLSKAAAKDLAVAWFAIQQT
jgi:hypothetical protein